MALIWPLDDLDDLDDAPLVEVLAVFFFDDVFVDDLFFFGLGDDDSFPMMLNGPLTVQRMFLHKLRLVTR